MVFIKPDRLLSRVHAMTSLLHFANMFLADKTSGQTSLDFTPGLEHVIFNYLMNVSGF